MGFIVILLLIGCLCSKKLRNNVLKVIIGILIVSVIIYLVITNISIVIPVVIVGFVALLIFGIISNAIENKHDREAVSVWLTQTCPQFTESMIENQLLPFANQLLQTDNNTNTKFDFETIPYGRTNAFLNYFDKTIDMEEPLFYSPIRSKDNVELREYGAILTLGGIYISKQLDVKDSNGSFKSDSYNITFNGMWKASRDGTSITIKYQDLHSVTIKQENTTLQLDTIFQTCQMIIQSRISLAIFKGCVVSEEQNAYNYSAEMHELDEEFQREMAGESVDHVIQTGGVMGTMPKIVEQYGELKYNMDGDRGHGYGAEYGNNVKDRVLGRNVHNTAADLENGRQVKFGADRTVNGVNIQTKYYKTASESIGAAFEHKKGVYLNPDGSMMAIEVPRDQYQNSLKIMKKRIDSGQVPGAKPGDDPKKYVRKGILTYAQSFNICKSGSIESLTLDALNGAVCSAYAGGITAVITFATQVWNGMPPKEAARSALVASGKVIGKGAVIYTVTMQLSRKEIINPFVMKFTKDGKSQGCAGFANPIYKLGDGLAQKIGSSKLAKSSIGQTLTLSNVTGRVLISGGVIVVITFGPDICRALVGRISPQQLFKNASVGVAGIAGGTLGQMLIPIPFVGAMIGGAVTGFVAKKVLDQFIEDDAIEMYQILREEFLDIVMLSNLNKQEFNQVVESTFANKKLPSLLRDMYAYGDAREFAREYIVSGAVIEILSKRQIVTDDMIDNGYCELAMDNTSPTNQPTMRLSPSMPSTETIHNVIHNSVQPSSLPTFCPNCGTAFHGNFCSKCGRSRNR